MTTAAWRDRCTEEAQTFTLVLIDGVLEERQKWDPGALADVTHAEPATLCPDCGVSPGQLHWPLCDMDYTADWRQIIGSRDFADFRTPNGDQCQGMPPPPPGLRVVE